MNTMEAQRALKALGYDPGRGRRGHARNGAGMALLGPWIAAWAIYLGTLEYVSSPAAWRVF